jgi:hypothetical protein
MDRILKPSALPAHRFALPMLIAACNMDQFFFEHKRALWIRLTVNQSCFVTRSLINTHCMTLPISIQ